MKWEEKDSTKNYEQHYELRCSLEHENVMVKIRNNLTSKMLKSLTIVYWISLIIKTTRICRAYYFKNICKYIARFVSNLTKKTKTNLGFIYISPLQEI